MQKSCRQKQSAGGMRDAIGMLEQLGSGGEVLVKAVAQNLGLTKPKAVEDFVFALLFKRLPEALETISGLVREGVNLIQFNKTVLVKLRDIMLQKVAENKLPEAKGVLEIIEEFTCANEELKNAVIPQLPLEVATISICSRKLVASSSQFTEVESKKVEMKKKVEVKVEERLEKKGVLEEKSEFEKKLDEVEKEVKTQKIETGEEISVPVVEAALPQVLGKIQNPTVKMVLKSAKIIEIKNNEIEIGVGSDFLIEKLDVTAQSLIAEKFSEVLGRQFQVKISRVEIEIQSVAPEPPQNLSPSKKTIAEAAEGLFEEGW